MIDIHSSSSQRVSEIPHANDVVDEEESSINFVEDENVERPRSATTLDHSFFESFQSEVSMSNINRGAETDPDDTFGASRKSSFYSVDGIVDETAVANISSKWPMTRELRVLKCLMLVLLFLAGILAVILIVLSEKHDHDTTCALVNVLVIGATGMVFWLYEFRAREREAQLFLSVTRSEAIVDSLFPEHVRDRILEEGIWSAALELSTSIRSNGLLASGAKADKNHFANGTTTQVDHRSRDDSGKISVKRDASNKKCDRSMGNPIPRIPSVEFLPLPPPPPPPSNTSPSFFSTIKRRSSKHSNDSMASAAKAVSDFCDSGDAGLDPGTHHNHKPHAVHSSVSSLASTSKPIADYFPCATIMFADIVGFTSWASVRKPAQVFELLETVYGRFDTIAKKKGVFKVETIGDCYVAATGLPNAMDDHAVVMANFARRILEKLLETVSDLEESLGPGTADLGMRVGIHSGSIIGGVLRAAKSRYQLFGDTMNTASRIESTSSKNKIHVSQQAAELIKEAGKGSWIQPRGEPILAKGKGQLKTYWLTTEAPKNLSAREELALPALLKMMSKANIDPGFINNKKSLDSNEKRERLVDYHTNVLKVLLEKLAAMRFVSGGDSPDVDAYAKKAKKLIGPGGDASASKAFMEEARKKIIFPTSTKVGTIASAFVGNPDQCTIDYSIFDELRELVSRVSRWYRDDRPFHTFEHASHTVLSITKLLAAIETTHSTTDRVLNKTKLMITHPLTQFVLIFAALVYDVGDTRLAAAETSFHRAWSLFLEPDFRDLRDCICGSPQDFEFFRRLLGKIIMTVTAEATDAIMDQDNGVSSCSPPLERICSSIENEEAGQKATAIVVTLLRVSDSHALNHFQVFQKWNKLLFGEAYMAFRSQTDDNDSNRIEDPSLSWYERELESFDDRVRLVRGLRDSGVFNKMADIYLNVTIANRREWQQKGQTIVRKYLHHPKRRHSSV